MSEENDDFFDEGEDQAVEEFNHLSTVLYERVSEFAEDEDVADDMLPLLLLQLSLKLHTVNYAESVAKPSAAGLKLDLDRFAATPKTSFAKRRRRPMGSSRRPGRRSQPPQRRRTRAEHGVGVALD
jgi:hypothetical protein